MKKNWAEYNTKLVKMGELLIEPQILEIQSQHEQTKKQICHQTPYRQTEGLVKVLFKEMDVATQIPNFRAIH